MSLSGLDIIRASISANIDTFNSLMAGITLLSGIDELEAEWCAKRLLMMSGRNTDIMARSLFKAFNIQLQRGSMASIFKSWSEEATGLDNEVYIDIIRTVLTLFVR